MLYLDYAKPIGERYILNFFTDKVEDIKEISNGKNFVTKNGIDYGIPLVGSTVIIVASDKIRRTYVLEEDGEWREGGRLSVQADYAQNDSTQPDYIQNRLVYGEITGSFDFKIISGELVPNSTMVVEINGVQYTDTVQTLDLDANMEEDEEATEEGSLDGTEEEHQLAYYIGDGGYFGVEKRDFPFAYSNSSILSIENEGNVIIMDNLDAQIGNTISLDGVSYYLKSYEGTPLLYVGNFYLISPEAEDTGENFVVLVNYANVYNTNIDDQTAPTPTYSTLIVFKNNSINFELSKPTKKLYETYIEIPTVEKNFADLKEDINNIDLTKKIEIKDNGYVNISLKPNTFYDFTGDLEYLTINCMNYNPSKADEYRGQFKSGATAPKISFPSDVKMICPSIEPNKTYQFSIVNKIGVVIGV